MMQNHSFCVPEINKYFFLNLVVVLCFLNPRLSGDTDNPITNEFYRANHGLAGGLRELVDLRMLDGFEELQNTQQVADFVSKIPGATGFVIHPDFEKGARFAKAVMWYTRRSATRSSWPLYLFNKAEAEKMSGDAPTTSAVIAAEAKVSENLASAKQLIESSDSKGVELSGDWEGKTILAMAVLRSGGFFKHTGEFGDKRCGSCRTVVLGGNRRECLHRMNKLDHWNCCGGDMDTVHCRYWELFRKSKLGYTPPPDNL